MGDQVTVFDDRICTIGEGPHYDDRTNRVIWIDIMGQAVHWRRLTADGSPGSGDTSDATANGTPTAGTVPVGADVGAAVPTVDGGLVLCLPDRLALWQAVGLGWQPAADLAALPLDRGPAMRSNDAKADPNGRLWHGTMAYDTTPGAAALYRFDPGADQAREIIGDVTISNGLGWSPDGEVMYYVDTPTNRVDRFDYDPKTGAATNRRPFVTVPAGSGSPDGLCVDAAGGIWLALWGGSAVHQYSPAGQLVRTVSLPTPQVTSCAFAGPGLDVLIITTAAEHRPDDPAAGRTYAYRPGDVTGAPCDRFQPLAE